MNFPACRPSLPLRRAALLALVLVAGMYAIPGSAQDKYPSKTVEIIVIEEPAKKTDDTSCGRKPGSAKGKVKMAPDFDAPLDDFAEYM